MSKKAQELEARTILQGLEEFATFMSFQGNSSGIRILSVETVNHSPYLPKRPKKADVVTLQKRSINQQSDRQSLTRSVSLNDRRSH